MKAKLIIRDECNVKIENLALKERKDLANKFKYEKPGVRFTPAVRLGRWDGKIAFAQLSGATYINLLPEILPFLTDRGYDFAVEDLREYNTVFSFDEVTADSFAKYVWPKGHLDEGKPITLRDYQIVAVNEFLKNPQCMQEISTGSGKTIMTAAMCNRCEPHGRTMVIVPNKSLVSQTEADFLALKMDVGVYYGDRKEFNKTHTICTWQSLNNLIKQTKSGEAEITIGDFIEGVVCVIVDECHTAKADVLKDMLTGAMAKIPLRWGFTGTIPKEEFSRVCLKVSLGEVIGQLSASELQDKGVLSQCHVNIVQLQDYTEFKDYASELKYLVTTTERLEWIAKFASGISKTGNTLILVDRIATGKFLQTQLSSLFSLLSDKPEVIFISGTMKVADRKDHYDDIADSTNKIIIATYGVAAVGINIPRIFNMILIEPGKSFVRVIQSIGRGIRKAADKDFVQIYDITSTCKFAKRHLSKRKVFYKDAKYPFTIDKVEWQ